MKIAYLIDQTDFGGVDVYTESLLSNWEKNDIIHVYLNQNYKQKHYLINALSRFENIQVFEYYSLKWNKYTFFLFPLFFIFSIVIFYHKLKKKGYDILFAQNGSYPGSYNILASLISSKLAKINHSILVVHHEAIKAAGIAFFIHPFLDKILQRNMDLLIAVSFATMSTIRERTFLLNDENFKTEIIHNGINYPDSILDNNTIEELEKGKGIFKIGIISRVEYYKGHVDLIRSLTLLPERIKNKVHLFFIGDCNNEFKIYISNLIQKYKLEKNITITGYLNYNRNTIISNLDIYISATKTFEGFGLSLAQAVANGVPIIATQVGAIPEYLPMEKFLIIKSSPLEISNSIIQVVENYDDYKNKAIKNRKTLENFDNKIISNQYRLLLDELISIK